MNAQHTPGPWIADDNAGFSPWSIWSRMTPSGHGKPGPKVAQISSDSEEADADAHLIAAAPELLEALCALVLNIDAGGATLSAMADARAAIAKATGSAS